jgi:hypothetical protein
MHKYFKFFLHNNIKTLIKNKHFGSGNLCRDDDLCETKCIPRN